MHFNLRLYQPRSYFERVVSSNGRLEVVSEVKSKQALTQNSKHLFEFITTTTLAI